MAPTAQKFRTLVQELPYGKRLPTAVYLHREVPALQDGPLATLVAEVAEACEVGSEFNVLKFRTDVPRLSFLSYPGFFDDAHPVLHAAVAVDLLSGKSYETDYSDSLNPPILHRKELLLAPFHPAAEAFARLSASEEDAGLYRDTTAIGFRANWERLLAEAGLTIDGHALQTVEPGRPVPRPIHGQAPVERHRTALTRYTLSRPVKTLVEYGQLPTGTTVFDYGCGLGSDVRGLREMGLEASGWDPVHAPTAERRPADVVNLGYVLNVIEDPAERVSTLAAAWALTRRLLVVSVQVTAVAEPSRAVSFGDGILTSRATFQKYFTQQEALQLIEDTLEHLAVPVGLGVFYVFRRAEDHEAFLTARTRQRVDWNAIALGIGERRERPASRRIPRPQLYDQHREVIDPFATRCLELGRLPMPEEYPLLSEVARVFGSPKRALALALRKGLATAFEESRALRRNDLLVYLASANFNRKVPFSSIPSSLRADIREFFVTYPRGLQAGLELLYSAADPVTISLACDETAVGWQEPDALYVHGAIVAQLPPVLRAYVACAERLYGDSRQADIVKVHKHSGKVSFLSYDGFDTYLLPELALRAKVNLRTQWVEVFDHSGQGELLFFKERYAPPADEARPALLALGAELRRLGVTDSAFLGPRLSQFRQLCVSQEIHRTVLASVSDSVRQRFQ